jgi:hypothetical protein
MGKLCDVAAVPAAPGRGIIVISRSNRDREESASHPEIFMSIAEVRNSAVSVSSAEFAWPADFVRVPDEEWTRQPVDQFGLNYDDGTRTSSPPSPRC